MAVPSGEIVGVVGESGSGKSTLALAVMRLLPGNATVTSGAIGFGGGDLLTLDEEAMRALRGNRIAMVFQDPMTSLNPVRSIGQQMVDIQHRGRASPAEKRRKAAAALKRVGMPDAESQLDRHPFQFSGGMRQRIAIAMALVQRPELLIADEVTTALDVTLEAQIIHLLRELRADIDGSILFISHNLGAIAEICDRVVVLYAGEVVEHGPIAEIFSHPQHPYTRALIACDPARISTATRELPVIPGDVPNLRHVADGCIFQPRCSVAIAKCAAERPPDRDCGAGHVARCHLVPEGLP
ncbi:MAG: ABC transporter ATP-binding protein [Rhizobiales bacterium]|nr:ABC transporter ATP-binding protein [Hyphomicrobiales bacterium]MBI3672442.1 ABC transporter ATP-binding protein [Hyphomicrobiales bacterium]